MAVLVADIVRDGQAVAVALEERAVPHRVVGDAAFFQRAEVRDLLAWLRLLADPSDAPAVVRALARAPIELRSVDIARCTQIARRRKLDMVAALAAATESPQVPPEARERIRVFLKLYRACVAQIDTMRPDLYVHRLIERLGLRRQQLFAAQADVVERLRALARFGELAAAHVPRSPQATAREFARSIAAVAEWGLSEREQPQLIGADAVQVLALEMAGGLEVDHVFVLGLRAGMHGAGTLDCEPVPDALLHESLPADDEAPAADASGSASLRGDHAEPVSAPCWFRWLPASSGARGKELLPAVEAARRAVGGEWLELTEDLFGPAETLHSTYRLLRDELMDGTKRAAGRLAELRLDTDLDISHAVVRYLELLKLAALIARDEASHGQGLGDALRDINARIEQAVTADQREIFSSSPLDEYLLDAERDVRHRAQVIAARDEPSLERFLPMRGGGVLLSASDIEIYRACPLRYKFARVFRIPAGADAPSALRDRRPPGAGALSRARMAMVVRSGSLTELLTLLETSWRRGGFGDSDEERQLHQKAVSSLTRYHERAQADQAQPVWFERQFSFKLGPHLVRGRVDRVDRLPSGEYELIDYKTGRPKSAEQLANDVQLSLYAIAAREAWGLEANRRRLLLPPRRPEGRHRRGQRTGRLDPRRRGRMSPRESRRRSSSRHPRRAPASSATTGSSARLPSADPARAVSARRQLGGSSPRWRRKRCSSRSIESPEGRSKESASPSSAAASSFSTNAWISGSCWTARFTWRSYSPAAASSSPASTTTPTSPSSLRISASEALGFGDAAM